LILVKTNDFGENWARQDRQRRHRRRAGCSIAHEQTAQALNSSLSAQEDPEVQ
jgi:hypothetical protein